MTLKNVNIGVLGHVDSGKTTLCKALSTIGSTAAFDSNPQSKERGITLDLGFSSFILDDKWNITLVDCPGHSSLIRTVIGGAQIMDLMLLIIDINKGMQLQAAECLILAQITCDHLVVVLNKCDLIPTDQRKSKIDKVTKLMRHVLSKTKFANEPIVAASALSSTLNKEDLMQLLADKISNISLKRDVKSPFLMAVDHCFNIKGQGTIVTGTVIQGCIKINDIVEFPSLKEEKKVKSIQRFKVPIQAAEAGDRIGVCVPGLDSSLIERSIICSTGLVDTGVKEGIIEITKISFFKKPIASNFRYHTSIGYSTITALLTIFKSKDDTPFKLNSSYEYVDFINEEDKNSVFYGLLQFDHPATILPNAILIGSDLQTETENSCRIAFSGKLLDYNTAKKSTAEYLSNLNIYKNKVKQGSLDRIVSNNAVIAKDFCKKESKIDHLIGLQVSITIPDTDFSAVGFISSRFGQTNKVRVDMKSPLTDEDVTTLKAHIKTALIELKFKKYLFQKSDSSRKLIQ